MICRQRPLPASGSRRARRAESGGQEDEHGQRGNAGKGQPLANQVRMTAHGTQRAVRFAPVERSISAFEDGQQQHQFPAKIRSAVEDTGVPIGEAGHEGTADREREESGMYAFWRCSPHPLRRTVALDVLPDLVPGRLTGQKVPAEKPGLPFQNGR